MLLYGLEWASLKQSHISFLSVSAKIILAAYSVNRTSILVDFIRKLYYTQEMLSLCFVIDSFRLFETITLFLEGKDYLLRPTVSKIRDSLEQSDISNILCIPGSQNIADSMMKYNLHTRELLKVLYLDA